MPDAYNMADALWDLSNRPLGDALKHFQDEWSTNNGPVPDILYHYTTVSGLKGIVESGALWASHVRFLNDASELTYADNLIQGILEEYRQLEPPGIIRDMLSEATELMDYFTLLQNPLVACFCEHGDLLSQWRGYAKSQLGYALGFSQSALRQRVGPPATTLRRVIYEPVEQRSLVQEALDAWKRAMDTELNDGVSPDNLYPLPALWVLESMLSEPYLCFKAPAFREEHEWRLVALVDIWSEVTRARLGPATPPRSDSELQTPILDSLIEDLNRTTQGVEVRFRTSNIGLIPYVEIPLFGKASSGCTDHPIRKVIQGATTDSELSLISLKLFLQRHFDFVRNVELLASDIPLR